MGAVWVFVGRIRSFFFHFEGAQHYSLLIRASGYLCCILWLSFWLLTLTGITFADGPATMISSSWTKRTSSRRSLTFDFLIPSLTRAGPSCRRLVSTTTQDPRAESEKARRKPTLPHQYRDFLDGAVRGCLWLHDHHHMMLRSPN